VREEHTREPCALDRPFEGARYTYLAANVLDEQGNPLFPGTAMRQFGGVKVGFIGMTLKDTGILVSPAGTAGYHFADEADTANRLAAELRAQGADTVVLLIHQGANVDPLYNVADCPEMSGDILPVLDRLDPGHPPGRLGPYPPGLHLRAAGVGRIDEAAHQRRALRLFRDRHPPAGRSRP
jgi:5'-nucleotidase